MSEATRKCAGCGKSFSPAAEWVRHCPDCAGEDTAPRVRFISEQGYLLQIAGRSSAGKYEHSIGGPHGLPGAVCNGHGCGRPFLRLITLDLRDPKLSFVPALRRKALGGIESWSLPLFYCWVCGGQPTYRLELSGDVTVLGRSSSGPEKDFPYAGYPESFPQRRVKLRAITAKAQAIVRAWNSGSLELTDQHRPKNRKHLKPGHLAGGEPYFVQAEHECGDCPACGALMAVIATASGESGSAKPFNEDPSAQVIFEYCAPCRIVSASYRCT